MAVVWRWRWLILGLILGFAAAYIEGLVLYP